MENNFSFKDLEKVFIKTTYPMEINGKEYEANETIALFDTVQLADINEQKNFVSADGGFDNRAHVWWERTKEVRLSLINGVFSKTQFAIMDNAKIFSSQNDTLMINCQETVESDENGQVILAYAPMDYLFIYDVSTGAKITEYDVIDNQTINIHIPFKSVLLDYLREYNQAYSTISIGNQLSNGTFILTGRIRVKDDETGTVKTGIITIPKLKLMSSLSIRLGENANPILGRLDAVAIPDGNRANPIVMDIHFLNTYIDSDI